VISVWLSFTSLPPADALALDEGGPLAVAIIHLPGNPTNDDRHSNPESMMSTSNQVFIGYRRDDGGHAGRLYDRLAEAFSVDAVFIDREDLTPGQPYRQDLAEAVRRARICLVVIGQHWFSDRNRLRLFEEHDVTRNEIRIALECFEAGGDYDLIPILTGGAGMPPADMLPPELAGLADIQALRMRDGAEEYREDFGTLIGLINDRCPGLRAQRQNAWVREGLMSPDQSIVRFSQDIAVMAPARKPIKRLAALSALDAWWNTWADHHQAFVLLGEEGDGKSWATADWLAGKLAMSDFAVPIVFAPALRMTSPTVTEILTACLAQSLPTPSESWPRHLRDLADQTPSKTPLFLLVVDALNERAHLDWRELFDTIRASPWREHVALLALCRSPYWEHVRVPDDGLVAPWTLPSFNEEELDQALAQRGSTRGQFDAEVLHLMARPRYFDLAFRLQDEVKSGGLTIERLIYEDWRDMTGRKRQQSCSADEFHALIADLAKLYEARRFAIPEFAQQAQGITNDLVALREELVSVRILDIQNGKLTIAPRYLSLGLGLVLAAEVEESGEDDPVALGEIIANRMGSYREADLQVRICGMALFHALNTRDYPEAGCLALLRAWIEGRNLDDEDLEKIAAYLPLRPKTYLRMAEYIWGEANNREAQDAFMAGFLRHRELPSVRNELVPAFTRWLGFVYPWGFRAYYEQNEEKLAEARQGVELRLGRVAIPGPARLLGVELEVVDDVGLLRLAQVAVAVISHDHAGGYANAMLTGIVASTVMDGSHAEFPWLLHTCRVETRQTLLRAAKSLLAAEKPTAYLVARKLLACTGNEEARALLENIPSEFRFIHPYTKLRENNPCDSHLWSWDEDNYLDCLERTSGHAGFIARQLKTVALNPDIDFPSVHRPRLDEAGNGLDLTRIGRSMGATLEQHHFEEMEPALCAFAAGRYQNLMRALARDMATRDGLARRQLAWHLLDHLPIYGNEEREIVLAAWRSTLLLHDEHDKVAQFALFSAVVFDLPADEQLQRLMERGDASGYISKQAPRFRPLSPEHGPDILAALKAVDPLASQRIYNLLWYLSHALTRPDNNVRENLLARFGQFDTVARGCCLEVFVGTGDADAAQRIIATGWSACAGRETFLENSWGSILLAEFGRDLPFDELVGRISSEWLGYAVKKRGYPAEEVAAYSGLLDAVWRRIGARTPPPEVESLSRYVVLEVNPGNERLADTLSTAETGPSTVRFANNTWGGSAGTCSVEDLMHSTDHDAQIEKHNALSEQVATLADEERDNGNPWFDYAFRDGGLAEVLALDDTLWRSWIEPVLRDDRRAWQLLALCRGFYEKLCTALLSHAPEHGFALFRAIRSRSTIRILDARLGLPVLLMDAFATPASPEVDQILRDHIDSGTTDIALFESALLCQLGGREDWMRHLANEWLLTDHDYDRSRGIALLGFSNAEADGTLLTNWIATHSDCWVRDVAETALQNHRRNVWARCWFDRFLSRDDRTESWAAFRLFLRCVDRRFWLWIDSTGLTEVEPWKRDAAAMNIGTIESACEKNEKDWKDNFLGQKVKPKEMWPWMEEYE